MRLTKTYTYSRGATIEFECVGSSSDGQILIESIVSITIALVGLLGVLTLLSRSLVIHRDTTQKFIATYLAAEGVETVKNVIDSEWARGTSWSDIQNGLDTGNYEISFKTCVDAPTRFPACIQAAQIQDVESSNYLYLDPATGAYDYVSGSANSFLRSPFLRTVNIINGNAEITVISKIRWQMRGENAEVVVEDHFFDWR